MVIFKSKKLIIPLILSIILIVTGVIFRQKEVNKHIPAIENDLKNSYFVWESRADDGKLFLVREYEFFSDGTAQRSNVWYAYDNKKSEYSDKIAEKELSGKLDFHVKGDIFGNYTVYCTCITNENYPKGTVYDSGRLTLDANYHVTNIRLFERKR